MAQQLQQPPAGEQYSFQQPATQQPSPAQGMQQGVQPQPGYQFPGRRVSEGQFEATLTPTTRTALEDLARAKHKAKWAADKTAEQMPQSGKAVRACEDVAKAAEIVEDAIVRNSASTGTFAQNFVTVAQRSLQDVQGLQGLHVTEAVDAIRQALYSTQQLTAELGQQQGVSAPQIYQQPTQQIPVQHSMGQTQPQQPRQPETQ